jgi:hypothetical protein
MVLTPAGVVFGCTRFLSGDPRYIATALIASAFWGLHNIFALSGIVLVGATRERARLFLNEGRIDECAGIIGTVKQRAKLSRFGG